MNLANNTYVLDLENLPYFKILYINTHMWAVAPAIVPLCGEIRQLVFLLTSSPNRSRLAVYCDGETGLGHKDPLWEQSVPHFSPYSPLVELEGPAALQGVRLWFYCIVQDSYSPPDGGLFFMKTFTSYCGLVQILKSGPPYSYTTVSIMFILFLKSGLR